MNKIQFFVWNLFYIYIITIDACKSNDSMMIRKQQKLVKQTIRSVWKDKYVWKDKERFLVKNTASVRQRG